MILTALGYDNGVPAKFIKEKAIRNILVTQKDFLKVMTWYTLWRFIGNTLALLEESK